MVAYAKSAVKSVTKVMIGTCARADVNVVLKNKTNSMIGTVVSVLAVVKYEMNSMNWTNIVNADYADVYSISWTIIVFVPNAVKSFINGFAVKPLSADAEGVENRSIILLMNIVNAYVVA